MANEKQNAPLLRITFDTDNVTRNISKFYENENKKASVQSFRTFPAVDINTGIMVCSQGNILVAHALSNYHCERLSDEADKVNEMTAVPREIVKMDGKVTLEVYRKGYDYITVMLNDQGWICGQHENNTQYPNWSAVFPLQTLKPVTIDLKKAMKAITSVKQKNGRKDEYMRITKARGENALTIYTDNVDEDVKKTATINIATGLYVAMDVAMNLVMLNDLVKLGLNKLYFATESHRVIVLRGKDTLAALMPYLWDDTEKYNYTAEDMQDFCLQAELDECIANANSGKASQPKTSQPMADKQPEADLSKAAVALRRLLAKMKAA